MCLMLSERDRCFLLLYSTLIILKVCDVMVADEGDVSIKITTEWIEPDYIHGTIYQFGLKGL